MSQEQLSDRSQHLLKSLVQIYIQDGQPVGSKTLAEMSGMAVSPATIRNVMADLEEYGYITSPHTSAGRIPTALGYRLFVDSLLTIEQIDDKNLKNLDAHMHPDMSSSELIESASVLLSSLTSQAGIVTLPKRDLVYLRQVEFLPLSGSRVLVILVLNEHEVQNRVIHTRRVYSAEELMRAANMINHRYEGQSLGTIRNGLLQAMQNDKDALDSLMQASIDVGAQAFGEQKVDDCLVVGQANLLDSAEPESINALRELFEAFQHKEDILHLMDRCVEAEGIHIFIGEESGYQVLGDYSVVTAPYSADGERVGVLGVIGPTRMAYERVIPVVDLTAKLLSIAMGHQSN